MMLPSTATFGDTAVGSRSRTSNAVIAHDANRRASVSTYQARLAKGRGSIANGTIINAKNGGMMYGAELLRRALAG